MDGTNLLCCRTGKQQLSVSAVPRIGRDVGRSFTTAQASSAVKGETENTSDDSLEAAVKGISPTPIQRATNTYTLVIPKVVTSMDIAECKKYSNNRQC